MLEFRKLLNTFRTIEDKIAPLVINVNNFKSQRLKNLLTYDNDHNSREPGMFPSNLKEEIN